MEEIALLRQCSDSLFEVIYAIYEKSFSKSEQKTKAIFKEIFHNHDYFVFVVKHNAQVEGFCIFFAPKSLDFILLEYMAINTTLRSQGIGSKLFSFSIKNLFLNEQTKPILIEIDSTQEGNVVINQKRADFYRKNGCKSIYNFEYILGLKSELLPPKMEMMIYGCENEFILKNKLKQYVQDIYKNVYFNEDYHFNIEKMFSNLEEKIILK